MNAQDQTLFTFLKDRLKGTFKEVDEKIGVEIAKRKDTNPENIEVIVVTLNDRLEEGELASLAATYLLLCGYDIVVKKVDPKKLRARGTDLDPNEFDQNSLHSINAGFPGEEHAEIIITINQGEKVGTFTKQ